MIVANILQPLIDVADAVLKFWHDTVGLSWGGAIIALTCTVRLLILPLTYKQVKGMQELQRFQPEMKRIQERYKDDKQRMQQEMMKFYKEHDFNPLSSCLPLILQLPFFITLFYLLQGDAFKQEIQGEESFLFIPDLAAKATGGVLVALIVIYIGTQLAASAVTALRADRQQRIIMFALPFVFTIFIINFPAGLIVYWITTNVWTVGQQLVVKRFMPKPEPIVRGDDDGSAPAHRKPAGAAALASGGDGDGGGDGKGGRTKAKVAAKAKGEAKTKGDSANGGPKKAPPSSPRKKKRKRSGRRR